MDLNLEHGRILLSKNRPLEAEKKFKQALQGNPQDVEALALLAECYMETSRYAQALPLAEQALALDPEMPLLYYILAKAQFFTKKMAQARQTIHHGLQLDPGDADFLHLLANIEFYGEKWQQALEVAERGLTLNPEHVNLINLRARALIKLNRKLEAAETVDFALRREPENSYSHANMGWIAVERSDFESALEHFRESLRLDPTNDFARSGLKEAIKAKNILYRYVLKYFLWISKLSEGKRWGFIIGAYLLYRVLLGVADNVPSLAPFIYPLVVFYILFAFSSWIASPVSNIFLQFHSVGKLALTDDEKLAANITGIMAIAAIICILVYLLIPLDILLFVGGFLVIMLIPIGGTFAVDPESKARRSLLFYTLGLAAAGIIAITMEAFLAFAIFGLGIFAFGWITNYLINREAKEFR